MLLICWFYLVFQGGPYGMKFNSREAGYPAPYGDGYGSHMVCQSANMDFLFHNCATVTLYFIPFLHTFWLAHNCPFCFLLIGYCGQSISVWCWSWSDLMGRTWEATHDSSLNLDDYCLSCLQLVPSSITARKMLVHICACHISSNLSIYSVSHLKLTYRVPMLFLLSWLR